ncbi:hypothetical protein OROGR_015176 [Orobanche gracilis]
MEFQDLGSFSQGNSNIVNPISDEDIEPSRRFLVKIKNYAHDMRAFTNGVDAGVSQGVGN